MNFVQTESCNKECDFLENVFYRYSGCHAKICNFNAEKIDMTHIRNNLEPKNYLEKTIAGAGIAGPRRLRNASSARQA